MYVVYEQVKSKKLMLNFHDAESTCSFCFAFARDKNNAKLSVVVVTNITCNYAKKRAAPSQAYLNQLAINSHAYFSHNALSNWFCGQNFCRKFCM